MIPLYGNLAVYKTIREHHTARVRTDYLYPLGVVIQEQHTRAGHLLGLHHGLKVSQEGHVFGHICGQHLQHSRTRLEKDILRAEYSQVGKKTLIYGGRIEQEVVLCKTNSVLKLPSQKILTAD